MLTLDRVTKVYKTGTFGGKELQAVRDVSFDVRPGEVVSLIGESGSGKSTIGRMILRLQPATDGVISFDGVDVRFACTTGSCRASSRTRSARTTRSSKPTGCSR
jgi:ABC-type oligopeptide transport system ATPase subunit